MQVKEKDIKKTEVSIDYLLHTVICKIGALKSIDPDELKAGDYYGVRYVLDEVYKDLEVIQDRLDS